MGSADRHRPARGDVRPHDALVRFVARFDRGEYWLAHEELEGLWQVDRRDFFKGLIQVAAAFVHVERRNWRGAQRLLTTAIEYLTEPPPPGLGVDADGVRSRAGAALRCVAALARGSGGQFEESLHFAMAPLCAFDIPQDAVSDVELPYRVRRHG